TTRRATVALVDRGEPQVAVGGAAKRHVLVQDRASHDVGPRGRGEEDLAAREVLAEAVRGRIDAAVLRAERPRVTARGLPRRGDGGIGVVLRRGLRGRG